MYLQKISLNLNFRDKFGYEAVPPLCKRGARGDRSLAELARALETFWPVAKRLEDPKHWPSLRTLDRAAAALGKRLVLSFE